MTALVSISSILSIVVGWFVGLKWTVYPWQVGLISGLPGFFFLLWRMSSFTDPAQSSADSSLFLFFPTIAIVSTYVGALAGRWRAIRKKASAADTEKSQDSGT
jgi:Na+-driven multidrug efflux pump